MDKPIASRVLSLTQAIETISFPHNGLSSNLMAELKKIPRSGKFYRFKKHDIRLLSRSIFDHIHSLANNADLLVDLLSLPIEKEKLANLFCFHDLAEVFVGDVPQFTTAEIVGAPVLTAEEKIIREKEANLFILSIFTGSLKADFADFLQFEELGITSELARVFHFFDRTDSIINIWRYVDKYRDQINIEQYIEAMMDFFINPHTL